MGLLWTAERLARHDFKEVYLVEPVIPLGGIVFLSGKRGIGKSHFCLTLAACLERRGHLFGRYPVHPTGPVVYVQADMPEALTQVRVKLAQANGYKLHNTYFFFPRFFDLLSLNENSQLVKEIQELQPCLVIWDTLRKIHKGSSNEDEVPSLVYGYAQKLFPTATHLFIHHEKKTVVEQEKLELDELHRGSGAWIDDADTGYRLSKVANGRLRLEGTKHRSCEEQPPIDLTLSREALLLYASADHAASLAALWRSRFPLGTSAELEAFLMSSFVGSARLAAELAAKHAAPIHRQIVNAPAVARAGLTLM